MKILVTSNSDSGLGTLREAIASAAAGDVILFSVELTGQTILLTSGINIPIGVNITVDGIDAPGMIISGGNTSRIFFVNGNVPTHTFVAFKNLTLVNGKTTERGGAISTSDEVTIVVENIKFNNNVADKGGGAIFSRFNNILTVTGCEFNGNKAITANDERGAGAIGFLSSKAITVTNSLFSGNKGINGGAINSLQGKLTVRNSRFVGNDTIAAFFDAGKDNDFLRGYGGAIYTDRASEPSETSGLIDIVNCFFQQNLAKGCGGAAYLYTGNQDAVNIASCTFLDNEVLALPGGNEGTGGGLVQMSNGANQGLTISDTTFGNNKVRGQGGAIWVMDAPTTIINSTFSENQVTGTGNMYADVGGAMALYADTTIVNTTIANNFANWVGGGISAAAGKVVTVQNTIFYSNTAANGTNNWGIQQHTSSELVDHGGNFQWPAKLTQNYNDYNATATITISDPLLSSLQEIDGAFVMPLLVGSPAIDSGVPTSAPNKDQRGMIRSLNDSGSYEFSLSSVSPTPTPIPPVMTVNLRVLNPDGQESNIFAFSLTERSPVPTPAPDPVPTATPAPTPTPNIVSISPTRAITGETITVNGGNFTAGAVVNFGAVVSTDVIVKSTTQISTKVPQVSGSVPVSVRNTSGLVSNIVSLVIDPNPTPTLEPIPTPAPSAAPTPITTQVPVPNVLCRVIGDQVECWDLNENAWILWIDRSIKPPENPQDVLIEMIGSLSANLLAQADKISRLQSKVDALESVRTNLELAIVIIRAHQGNIDLSINN